MVEINFKKKCSKFKVEKEVFKISVEIGKSVQNFSGKDCLNEANVGPYIAETHLEHLKETLLMSITTSYQGKEKHILTFSTVNVTFIKL